MTTLFASIPIRLRQLFDSFDPEHPWHLLPRIETYIRDTMRVGNVGTVYGDCLIDDDVEIGAGTIIEHGAVIKGPAIIGKNCEIRAHAYIRGGVITGDHCVVGHTTEVVRSVLMDGVRMDHFNYVGDSVIGNHAHFGAGAKVANLRFDEKEIIVNGVPTGLKKFGVILGDASQIGVNATVGPGVIFEKNAWLTMRGQLPAGRYSRESLQAMTFR
ncbi:hypothetical protein HYV71_02110 [Candidatus Uhrbacteria bacterium]|nr:hypothetical protein [Candidatus Uhrbacteria bacterium]